MKHEELEHLLDIMRRMAETRDLTSLLDYAIRQALGLVNAQHGSLVLLQDDGTLDFRVTIDRDGNQVEDAEDQISMSILSAVIRTSQPVVIANALDDSDYSASSSVVRLKLRSVMCVPLISRGTTIGAMYVENRSLAGAFSEAHLPPLAFYANQVAVLIENAALHDDLETRVKARTQDLQEANTRLAILRRVDTELVRRLDMKHVLTIALDAAMRMSLADAGFIGLADNDGVHVVRILGDYPDEILGSYLTPNTGLVWRVIQQRKAEWVTDISADPDYVATIAEAQAQFAVPLNSYEHFIGVLSLETHVPERFTSDVFESVKLLASHIAIALDNSRMYEEREQLVEELDAFAHTVAHDLKSPLTAISGYADILSKLEIDSLTQESQQQCLDAITRGVRKMDSIISALLLLASVRKSDKIPTAQLDMAHIVAEVRQRLENAIQTAQAEIVAPEMWPVALGYAPWVEEIWSNYLSNAIKYGGRPPQVELGAEVQSDGMARFWVRDNGHGLTPEEQSQLFIPFTRLSHPRDVEGHGLGLSIVHRIAERLGGEVSVESQVGKGSVFSFTLPLTDS